MPIFRIAERPYGSFFIAQKTPFEDPHLSWKAKGLLAYLLTKPDNWEVRIPDLNAHSSTGVTATRSAIKELKEAGYIRQYQEKDELGRFGNSVYLVYETPFEELGNSTIGNSHMENPYAENPYAENPKTENLYYNNKKNNNKENNNKEIDNEDLSKVKKQNLRNKDSPKEELSAKAKDSFLEATSSLKGRLIAKKPSAEDLAMALGLTAKEKHDVPWELAELFALQWGGWTWPPPSKATAAAWREFAKQLLTRCGGDIDGIKIAIRTFFDSDDHAWEKQHFRKPRSFLDSLVILYNRSVGKFSQDFALESEEEKQRPIERPQPSEEARVWDRVLESLHQSLAKDTFTYFAFTKLIEKGEGEWVIEVPHERIKQALENELAWYLEDVVKTILPEDDLPKFTFKARL